MDIHTPNHLKEKYKDFPLIILVQNMFVSRNDIGEAVIALTKKLMGNSLYSASLLNKSKHQNFTYHSEKTINRVINDPHFMHLDEIASDLYEVKNLKLKI